MIINFMRIKDGYADDDRWIYRWLVRCVGGILYYSLGAQITPAYFYFCYFLVFMLNLG